MHGDPIGRQLLEQRMSRLDAAARPLTVPLHQSFPFAGRKSVGWRSAISSATIETTTRERKLPGGSSQVFEIVGSFGNAGHSLSCTQK